MSLLLTLDALRGRFGRLKHGRSYLVLGKEIGVNPRVLLAFVHGDSVTQGSLEKIERWCDAQEAQVTHEN